MALLRWSGIPAAATVGNVPKLSADDLAFAGRIANVLRLLRARAGLTQDAAAYRVGVPTGKLGRWERGDFPPKGKDLGKLFAAYEEFGAEMKWFLFPPAVSEVNPVRARLDELARLGASEADEAEERVAARRLQAAGRRVVVRGKRTK